MIKAIIFDCFGVVYDDNFDLVWGKLGGDIVKDDEFIKKTFHKSHTGEIESSAFVFAKHLGISVEDFNTANDEGRGIDQEVLDYVFELRGTYKVAMLSNIGSTGLEKYIPREVLDKCFDIVIESSSIGYAKPEANAYEITADSLGVRLDECIMIDDRQEYIDGAVRVGMSAVLYKNLEQLKSEIKGLLV